MNQAFQDWVEDAKAVSLLEAAFMVGAKLKQAGNERVGPCPICGGKDRFSVNPVKGAWNCRGAKGGHDSISLVMHTTGRDFKAAVEFLTGTPPPDGRSGQIDPQAAKRAAERREKNEREAEQRQRGEARKAADKRGRARRTWAGRVEIPGTPVEAYLTGRKLEAWRGIPSLGFNPKVWHDFDKREYPALLGCAVGPDMKFKSLWRIYLDETGNKAKASQVKMGLGPLEGGAVWLATRDQMNDGIWGICEGIETGLAIRELFKGENDKPLPVFAGLSTSGVQSFAIPQFVKHLVIYPDGDIANRNTKGEWREGAGQIAASKLSERLKQEGLPHSIEESPTDGDWNDCLVNAKESSIV